MRPETVTRLVILIAVLSFFGGLSFFAHAVQLDRNARSRVKTADLAEKEGNFPKAEKLYREYLEVFPKDVDVNIKLAGALLKVDKSPERQNAAIGIYSDIVRRKIGREDARRPLMQLMIDTRHFSDAALHLDILLKTSPHDGNLLFLRGQCYEAAEDYKKAEPEYEQAIEHNAPQWIEAYQQLAILRRDKLEKPKDAEQAIKEMVQFDPENPEVYLVRGRYRLASAKADLDKALQAVAKADSQNGLNLAPGEPETYLEMAEYAQAAAEDDFQKALQLAPGKPDIYLEMAGNVEKDKSGRDKARQILKNGLKKAPKSIDLYGALAKIELDEGQRDKAIKILEDGVKRVSACDLRLMSSVKELSDIPTGGKDLIIVAAVDHVLHFRMFDGDGKVVVDTDEKRLTEQARQIEDLRKQLGGWWPPHELTESEHGRVITAVTSIVGHALVSPAPLRVMLAEQLARPGGDAGKMRLQIEELKRIGYAPVWVEYLTALYDLKTGDFSKASKSLLSLQGIRGLLPYWKAKFNLLLADCHRQLGDPESEQEARQRAVDANPQDPEAKLGWISNLVNQGKTEEAIKEYQALVERAPEVRLPLAELLIARNLRRSESQRDWKKVKQLIDDAGKAMPKSVEPVLVRAELLWAQDKADEARNVLEKARLDFPESVAPWTVQATLMARQGRVDKALSVLDQAQRQLGDQVELRLARARLWATQKGPQVVTVLNDLAQNTELFSKQDRRKLLGGLANELIRQQDFQGASRLWSQLAELDPNNLELRLTLLDLALQIKDKDEVTKKNEIEKNINEIERIEGSKGLEGRFAQVKYLIWQAEQGSDKAMQKELRASARLQLNELRSRRADWSVIPWALARLEEQELAQELAQDGLTEKQRKAREESIVSSYIQAIELGQRNSAAVFHAFQLLFKSGRGNDARELLNRIPVGSRLFGDLYLRRLAAQFAVENRDFQRAEEIARTAVAADPGDFLERIWLVDILLISGHLPDAENELRQAVDFDRSDPDRWIALVEFMVKTKQPAKAETAVREAKAALPQPRKPLALARCCELVGRAYETENTDDAKKKQWYAEAKTWYEKAQDTQPDDLSITRRLTQFFLDTKQTSEAKSQLYAILKQGADAKTAGKVAWARRVLAWVLASDADDQEKRKALSLFEPDQKPAAIGEEGKTVKDPEDLQVLARVLELQKTPQHRKRAIEILESLTDKKLANSDDQFLLAGLYDVSGDWPKSRERYRELNLVTKNPRDMATLDRRLIYLTRYANSLLQHHRPGEEQDLTDAQELVNELKQLQPNVLAPLLLQVEIDLAHNQPDSAAKLLEEFAKRANLPPQVLEALANLAEKLYRQLGPAASRGRLGLAAFLGRRHVKEALDICEPLYENPGEMNEDWVGVCIALLTSGKGEPDRAQLDQVSGWLEQARKQKTGSTLLLVGLANLREQQERYPEAEALYQSAVKPGDDGGGAINSKLIADACNNLAWLMALYDRKGRDALSYIDNAINLKGPLPDYLDTRGVVYLTAGNSQLAINDLERAVALAPSPSKYFHLAHAYLGAKNKEKAKQAWQRAKIKRFEQSGLHPLEKEAYQKTLTELGVP